MHSEHDISDNSKNNAWLAQIKDWIVDFRKVLRNISEAFHLFWEAGKSTVFLGFFLTIVTALLPSAFSWISKLLIDAIIFAANSDMVPKDGLLYVAPYIGLEFILIITSSLSNQIQTLFDRTIQFKLTRHINNLIIRQTIQMDLLFFENPIFHDTLKNARRQADVSAINIVNATLLIVQHTITLISLIFLLLRFSPWLTICVFLAAVPSFLSQSQFAEKVFRVVSRRAPKSRMLNYIEQLLTSEIAAKEVKLLGLGEELLNRYQTIFSQFYEEDRIIVKRRIISGWGWSLLSNLAYYGSLTWVIFRTVAGFISLGDLTMFQTIYRQSQRSIRTFLDSFTQVYENNLYFENLLTYLNMKPMLVSPVDGLKAAVPIRSGIEFKNVSFRYPGLNIDVLKNINLHIYPGERIALVGLNGAGKTTFVKLLTRLYAPTSGQILLDGVDLCEYDLTSLRQLFGVVFQDFVHYEFSVRENIGFGQIDAMDDLMQIRDAAAKGGADMIVENLPDGYNTILGRRWEEGHQLSGGQWQKIALSRAFMRKAEVLILDEPTSALDAEAEYRMFRKFGELIEGRMAVLISHRFSTVRMADRIVVLADGRIIEMGNHDELMKLEEGTYSRLFDLQAEGYR
jgi:ATP-binding cassette subfamily B protein